MKFKCAILFVLIVWAGQMVFAQEKNNYKPLTRILFVFDASQSMSATWGNAERIQIAKQVLIEIVDSLERIDNVEMALRIYGHQSPVPPQDCSDTRLEVPFSPNNAARIRQKLRFVSPKGTTPIASSLSQAVNDFPSCPGCRNIIILITDGIEACDGDPCAVSLELQKNGIILKPFVIGIGLDPGFRETFDCVGYYFNVLDEFKFKETLGIVVSQVLNETTAQVNLLDVNGKPTESDVNMTFYDLLSGQIRYNLVHTINALGNPDTLYLDHLTSYRLLVHTLPPIEKDSVSINSGRHTVIALKAAQGYLSVKTLTGKAYENQQFIIRKSGDLNTLTNQKIGEPGKYLIGKYDIEIPVIPVLNINDIEILQSHTTLIEIPTPGTVVFSGPSNGFGSLYSITKNTQTWIHNLNPSLRSQSLLMQPGNYRVVFRSASARGSVFTIKKDFSVEPGKTIIVELN
jgi:Ca-activated chloride channel homolog